MKKIILSLLLFCLSYAILAQDTFSIVAVDPETGEIGSAAASCVDGVPDDQFVDFLTAIIPNRGGIMSQAFICVPNPNLANAETQMANGASPSEIIDFLLANDACAAGNFNPQWRQYGIADFDSMGNPRTAGFTGSLNESYAEDRQGANYSIQGNILLDASVIDNMEANFLNTEGTLADKLMAAMQGANFPGADSRCLVDNTSSKLAYLMVYRPDDDPDDPYLRLAVPSQAPGVEPIDMLQDMYTSFLSTSEFEWAKTVKIAPNPVKDNLILSIPDNIMITNAIIVDIQGRQVFQPSVSQLNQTERSTNIQFLASGFYVLKLNTSNGQTAVKFLKH